MVTIAACMIVKNEEEMLGRCLESLKGFDEIIVCDTGSKDNTVEIAKKYTDKVFTDYKWEDSFCKARNHVLDKATADWVYSIDADEYLISSVEKIKEWVEIAEKNGWLSLDVCIEGGPTDKFYFPRLFKRCPQVRWHGDIHNYISVAENHHTDIIHHYDYSPAHKLDPERSFRILSKVVADNPKCVREKFYLAREYWYRKDYVAALAWYEEYLKVAWWGPEMAEAWMVKARCLYNLGRAEEAKAALGKCLTINSNFKEAILFLAAISGPGNQKRWKEFAETATNEGVLFVRT